MRNEILTLLAAATLTGASAQTFNSPRLSAPWQQDMSPRTGLQHKAPGTGTLRLSATPLRETAQVLPEDYGPLSEVMHEDFSLMATGSVGAWDTDEWLEAPEYEYPWINMADGYTHLPGWGAHSAYPAGGCIALVAENGQANLNTMMLDVSASELHVLEFKALAEGDGEIWLAVEAAETFNMSPTWDICSGGAIEQLAADGEWHTYRYTFMGGGHYTLYNMVVMTPGVVYIDDVSVSTIDKYLGIPSPKGHREYLGSSFKALWTPAENAEGYLVTLYEALDEHTPGMVLREGLASDTNSLTIDGLESGLPCFYDVRAVGGGHTGYPSNPCFVWNLEAPVFAPTGGIDGYKYEAEWSEVPTAERYNYWAFAKRTPEADGPFTITKESYDQLTDHEGHRMDWTHENNEGMSYDEYRVMGGVRQAGWRAKHSAPFHDYLCIDGWWYIQAGEDAGLLSPEMDLSADGGRAQLKLMMASEFMPADSDWNQYGIDLQTQCAVAIFNWDEEKGDYTQAALYYPGPVSLQWTEFTVDLEGLTDRSVIGIYAVSAPLNLYIASLELTQQRRAGESFLDPYLWQRYHEGTVIEVEIPWYASGTETWHCVNATSSMVHEGWGGTAYTFQDGEMSALELAGISEQREDDVAAPSLPHATINVDGGVLAANAPGSEISVYTADGRLLARTCDVLTLTLPARGLYVVKTQVHTLKAVW